MSTPSISPLSVRPISSLPVPPVSAAATADNPPFSHRGRTAATIAVVAAIWSPAIDSLPVQLGPPKLVQPFVATADNPPFSHQGRNVTTNVVRAAWEPGPPLPTLKGKLTPPSVDQPPFVHGGREAIAVITRQAWEPGPPQPILGVKLTPPSVDQPPVRRLVVIPPPVDDWRMPQRSAQYVQPFVVTADTVLGKQAFQGYPPSEEWRFPQTAPKLNPLVLGSVDNPFEISDLILQVDGPTWPISQRRMSPALLAAVTTDNPPFSHPGRLPINQPTNWSDGWSYSYNGLASGDQPYAGRQSTPPSVDNPPRFSVATSILVRASWEQITPAPITGAKLTPPSVDQPPIRRVVVTSPPVDDWRLPQRSVQYVQPFVVTADTVLSQKPFQGYPAVDEWRYPQTSPKYVQPYSPDNPPFSQRTVTTIVVRTTWDLPDPAPTQGRKLTPPSVDNPPPSHIGRSVVTITRQMWEVDPPAPILGKKQTPPSVDNPPFIRVVPATYPADPWLLPQTSAKIVQPFDAGTTPLRPTHYEVYLSWLPLDVAPTQSRRLNPSILAVAVDNPPFTHWGRLAASVSVVLSWQPGDPLPTLPKPPIPQGGVTPPPVTAEKFTVSGPTVESLFHPVGDISWNWGGGTQKRTV